MSHKSKRLLRRIRNWAAFAVLVPATFVVALVMSPVIGVALAIQIVDKNLNGGLK